MKTNLLGILGAAALSLATLGSASASTDITSYLNMGWYSGADTAQNAVQTGGPFELIVPSGGQYQFSLTDGFLVGDTYSTKVAVTTVSGPSFTVASSFSLYTGVVQSGGPAAYFNADWLNSSYSHSQFVLTEGTYFLTVKDTANIGYPAHFGFQVNAVPEVSTWAMMFLGFAALGFAGFRSRRSVDLSA